MVAEYRKGVTSKIVIKRSAIVQSIGKLATVGSREVVKRESVDKIATPIFHVNGGRNKHKQLKKEETPFFRASNDESTDEKAFLNESSSLLKLSGGNLAIG